MLIDKLKSLFAVSLQIVDDAPPTSLCETCYQSEYCYIQAAHDAIQERFGFIAPVHQCREYLDKADMTDYTSADATDYTSDEEN